MNIFLRELHKYKRKLNLQGLLRLLGGVLICLGGAAHLYYLCWLNLPSQSLLLRVLNYFLRGALALLALWLIHRTVKGSASLFGTARWLDRQTTHDDDLFQNLCELKDQKQPEPVLNVLASQAEERIRQNRYRFPRLVSPLAGFALLSALAGLSSLWALNWTEFRLAMKQFYTNNPESVAYKRSIELSPGNATLGKGQQLIIHVLNPDPRLTHRLYYRWDKQWRELGMADNAYSFPRLEYSLEYYVANEVAKSPLYRITCLDEPYARNWKVQYQYPAYTGLPPALDTLSYGNIEAFRHSEAILSLQTNIPARQAVMRFSDGSEQALQASGAGNFSTRLKITEPKTWYLELKDALGRVSRPEEKTISIIPDQPPEVRVLYPGEDVVLNQNLQLPLVISADDDFGLRDLSLRYQVESGAAQSVPLRSVISGKLITLDHSFDLRDLGLLPGNSVTYWAEVYDNSPQRQMAQSGKYKARFPSIEEIYREIEQQEKLRSGELQSTLQEAKQLQQDFEEKRRELLKDKDLQWEDKKQLEKILDEQDKLNQQVENVADDFQNLMEKMQLNDAISADMLQKMQKIQELMQEISNDELREAMSKLEQAMLNMKPEDLRKAMENYKFSLEDFARKIEQTLQLLESIKKEQALEKALQISQEMEKMQSALKDKAGDSKQSSEKLASEQQDIAQKLENLQKALEDANSLLDPAKDKKEKQELSQLQQEMKSGQLQQNLSQSQKQLMQNQRSSAQQAMSEALEKMRRYTLKLAELRNSMGGGSQREVAQAMQNAVRELLIFSKQHEELSGRYGSDPYQIVGDLIAHYEGIQVSLNRLYRVPQVSLFLPPKFYLDLAETNKAYREIFINVSEMQYARIPEQLATIQKGLNLMSYDLIQALNKPASGGGGGGGMQSLMQMLGQMGQEQMALNMLTEQLLMQMQQQGGRMSAAMQQQIQKLASDQERLAENLKRALQNNPEAQKQGNAIKQIIDEAEAISRQLRYNQLSEDLLRRQENIISRLLDAQRSINKREFSEKRKGETADPSIKQLEVDEDYSALRRKALLDDAYRSFPPAYQQVILKYLKLLSE